MAATRPEPTIQRLLKFLRSVLPTDPSQLLFLGGTIFLFISPRLSWWPKSFLPLDVIPDQRTAFFLFMSKVIWLVVVPGLVAYFLCFWSVGKPILNISLGVFLPALVGLGCVFHRYFQLSYSQQSVLETRGDLAVGYEWFGSNLVRLPVGVFFCVLGLFLIFAFGVRIRLGLSSLPISVVGPGADARGKEGSWNRSKWLIFVFVGPCSLLGPLVGLLLSFSYFMVRQPPVVALSVMGSLATVLDSVIMVAVLLVVLGKVGRDAVSKSMNLPEPRFAFIALLFSVAISLMCAAIPYTAERIHWATYNFGRMEPPQFSTYFEVSRVWDAWLLLLVFGAMAEEIIFRGGLLPRLVQRYGFWRGIFFTGLVWAAFHFRGDSYSGLSVAGVLYHLLWRILFCLAMNYVFSWMTLRWKSVIPSTVAHAAWNIIAIGGVNEAVPWSAELGVVLWAVLAVLLFRYWPLRDEGGETVSVAGSEAAASG